MKRRRPGTRCGSSRSLGTTKQCAIYERGSRKCVWCEIELAAPRPWGKTKDDPNVIRYATVDHLDGDRHNNEPHNLVAACNGCNVSRANEWHVGNEWEYFAALTFEWWDFDLYLAEKSGSISEAIDRVESQRWAALDSKAGKALAWQWHRSRVLTQRRRSKERARQKRKDHHENKRSDRATRCGDGTRTIRDRSTAKEQDGGCQDARRQHA